MNDLYPLKFNSIFKDKIWGGDKIDTVLGKNYKPLPNCGETWELSGVCGNVSTIANGFLKGKTLNDLIKESRSALLGGQIAEACRDEFPLLIKFIDARQDLSIQVHPDDETARRKHNGRGKTEMWYVVQADPQSTLISGFNRTLTKEDYLEAFHSGSLPDILNKEEARAGDVFFIPAGRVHTIGRGLLVAEIQQASDITYRLYDFDRTDARGNKRELHVEDALDAIDFKRPARCKTTYKDLANRRILLERCEFFTTNKLRLTEPFEAGMAVDSFKVFTCVDGEATVSYEAGELPVSKGEAVLIPSCMQSYSIVPAGEVSILESYIE